MKKKKKKNKYKTKKKPIKKSYKKRKKNRVKRHLKKKQKIKKKKIKSTKTKKPDGLILNIIRFQESLGSKLKFKLNFNFLSIDRSIQNFFQKIENQFEKYKIIKAEEKKRLKIEEIERVKKEKEDIQRNKLEEEKIQFKLKQQLIKEEERLEKARAKDIKLFLRKEQAILRKEQAERQKRFLQEIKLDQQIEKFRVREIKELEKLEKISLKEQREDYAGLQERIDKLKQKYQLIRDQKIRERVEALGVEVVEGDDRFTLLQKEKDYNLERQKIENALESFYRSANSLVFQLNKRYLTRQMSIFRCIDRRFETGEIFIKWDESQDDEWLILIYIKDNSPDKGIIIEDKTNPEKNSSYEYKPSEIFKASDIMVDSLTQLLSRERSKIKKITNI